MPYKDPEQRRAYGREWIRNNAEKARDAMRRWRKNHPAEHAAQSRDRYARDPEKVKRIINASPNRADVRRAMRNRRRDAIRGLPSFSATEWQVLVAQYAGRCAYCGGEAPLQIEHRIPLCAGGANTIDNILPACGPCNIRKGRMTDAEFRARVSAERRGSQP